MNENTKERITKAAGSVVGLILGPGIVLVIAALFGYHPCPSCLWLLKTGTIYCPHCYSKIAWGSADY